MKKRTIVITYKINEIRQALLKEISEEPAVLFFLPP